jgi:t-SNARE complex subunit (syntaxin)
VSGPSSLQHVLVAQPIVAQSSRLSQHVDPAPEQVQAQAMQSQLSPHELAYQESLIQEREAEIREIETGIHELSEIFRDLGTLVHEQGGMLGQSPLTLHLPSYVLNNVSRACV